MNSFRLIVLLLSGLAFAQSDGGRRSGRDGGFCVRNPNARFTIFFDRTPLMEVVTVVSDLTCKPVVVGPGAEKAQITIGTREKKLELTVAQFFEAFVAAAEVNGLKVVEEDGTIRITK